MRERGDMEREREGERDMERKKGREREREREREIGGVRVQQHFGGSIPLFCCMWVLGLLSF